MMAHQTNKKGGEGWAEVQVGPPAAQNPDGADVAWKLKDNLKKKNSCLDVACKLKTSFERLINYLRKTCAIKKHE